MEHETDLIDTESDKGHGTQELSGSATADMVSVEQATVKPRHFACFDGLRAIAAVSVHLLHTAWVSGFTRRSSLGAYTSRLEIGVSVFFLISGFLLNLPPAVSHLTERPSVNVRKFWERRLLRIVPAYWLALTVLTYVFHIIELGPGWQGVAIHYLFLQIYFPTAPFLGITQAWSLCTEMSFYLVSPCMRHWWVFVGDRRSVSWSGNWQVSLRCASSALVSILGPAPSDLDRQERKVRGSLCPQLRDEGHLPGPHGGLAASVPRPFSPSGMLLAVLSVWFTERESEPTWLSNWFMPWISWAGADKSVRCRLTCHEQP